MLEKFLRYIRYELGLSKNTISAYKKDIQDFLDYLTKLNLVYHNATANTVQEYVQFLSKNNIISSSLNRKISSLRNFFIFLLNENEIIENPIQKISKPKLKKELPNFLSQHELQRLLDTVKNDESLHGIRDYCILSLLIATGMRISELVELKLSSLFWVSIQNLEFEAKISVVGKGNKERIIPINREASIALSKYLLSLKNLQGIFLFPSKKSPHISRVYVGLLLKKIARIAGIDDAKVHPHAFRHSTAINLLNGGMDIRLLQEFLGHKDISTTQIYTQINANEVKNFVEEFHPFAKM